MGAMRMHHENPHRNVDTNVQPCGKNELQTTCQRFLEAKTGDFTPGIAANPAILFVIVEKL